MVQALPVIVMPVSDAGGVGPLGVMTGTMTVAASGLPPSGVDPLPPTPASLPPVLPASLPPVAAASLPVPASGPGVDGLPPSSPELPPSGLSLLGVGVQPAPAASKSARYDNRQISADQIFIGVSTFGQFASPELRFLLRRLAF